MVSYGTQIMVLHKQIHELLKERMKHLFDQSGLTAPQLMVIGVLTGKHSMKVSEISGRLGLSNSTVSGIIDRLEKMHFVQRIRAKEDRRVVLVSLTENAKKQMKISFQEEIAKNLDALMREASEEDIKIILNGLETLKKVLATEVKDKNTR